ncbi:DUF3592 domain-containing protein [Streptomyces xanthochromogenes]|uniref:DUF3592 domain-containing protein n=1 Tax=Streptomyces xanthochromogenes TaxID=67384 RepID=UPI002F41F65E
MSGMLLIPLAAFVLLDVVPQLRNRKLMRVGVRVDGVCTYIYWSSESQRLRISYVTQDGTELEHQTPPIFMPNVDKGDVIELYYDPSRPTRAVLAKTAENHAAGRILSGPLFYLELLFLFPQAFWVYFVTLIHW